MNGPLPAPRGRESHLFHQRRQRHPKPLNSPSTRRLQEKKEHSRRLFHCIYSIHSHSPIVQSFAASNPLNCSQFSDSIFPGAAALLDDGDLQQTGVQCALRVARSPATVLDLAALAWVTTATRLVSITPLPCDRKQIHCFEHTLSDHIAQVCYASGQQRFTLPDLRHLSICQESIGSWRGKQLERSGRRSLTSLGDTDLLEKPPARPVQDKKELCDKRESFGRDITHLDGTDILSGSHVATLA